MMCLIDMGQFRGDWTSVVLKYIFQSVQQVTPLLGVPLPMPPLLRQVRNKEGGTKQLNVEIIDDA